MDIRKPTGNELAAILELSVQALFDGTIGRARPTEEKVRQLVEPLLAKGGYYLIATEEDRLMGWVLLGTSRDQFTDIPFGFIYELYVIEEYRGRGISKQLMERAIEQLKEAGLPEVRLSVFVENHAVGLYRKLGFTERSVTMSMPLK
ncbi:MULTISPECIES: GNAT family N-acetyltransferase [Brevibacillus]|uniref:GNAT family N-acetyltransferase n=1 Tax=Brevibacillus TaxID=55080 RepID=UPI0004F32247|nr:GNAT family N-acetyltransferase [Brevibacillus borstelensis]KKX56195.1 acetyltransferase [Brevibacillus borstelensis cifa_chp40]MCM3592938.1 GNAT family N-acetyltransferase [Brevibacillus borstelensis]MED1745513.1 GNAT family N-acetyltransferase [Brevibacillus borstelensis]MED1881295.1 GNAT family N-acetyltransferase [Brevibacillus borstelensis]NOU53381.1 GNAT family N-acetyltransferase [Brevibacillus borstelensis]